MVAVGWVVSEPWMGGLEHKPPSYLTRLITVALFLSPEAVLEPQKQNAGVFNHLCKF